MSIALGKHWYSVPVLAVGLQTGPDTLTPGQWAATVSPFRLVCQAKVPVNPSQRFPQMLFPHSRVLKFYFPEDQFQEADHSVLLSGFLVKFSLLINIFQLSVIWILTAVLMISLSFSCRVVQIFPTLGSFRVFFCVSMLTGS